MAENAQAISDLGKALHKRIVKFTGHLNDLGRHLGQSIQSYNKAVGSLESRVLPAARRFKEMGIGSKGKLEKLSKVEYIPRSLAIEEENETVE